MGRRRPHRLPDHPQPPDTYDFIEVVSPTEVWPFVLHGWFLAGIMLMAEITGFGRMYEAPDGSPVRKP